MPREAIEIVRIALAELRECYLRNEATQDLLELCAPDVRVDATHRVFNPEIYEGHEGLRRVIREVGDSWESFETRDDRLIEAGDRVVVIQTIRGRGRISKAEVEQTGALIYTVRDGLVVLVEIYGDSNDALRSVGLAA